MFHSTKTMARTAGFTIIELLIAITLTTIVVTVFISATTTMVRSVTVEKTQLELSQKNQVALDILERDIRMALAFDTTVSYSTFVDKYGPTNTDQTWSGAWSYKGSNPSDPDHRVLILRETATSTNPLRVSRTPVYVDGHSTTAYAIQDLNLNCTTYNASTAPTGALTYNPALPYYLIYFVRDNNLYRRTLTDTSTTLCNGPQYQKQSCPEVDTTPYATCQAYDELIATDVGSFTVAYNTVVSSGGTTTITDIDAYSQSASDIFQDINNAVVTLKLQKIVYGADRGTTLSVRVSRVN